MKKSVYLLVFIVLSAGLAISVNAQEHLMFMDIEMGQPVSKITSLLKSKGFVAGKYNMRGRVNGVDAEVWVADDGKTINVSELKSYPKQKAIQRINALKAAYLKQYGGKAKRMNNIDGMGFEVTTDLGTIEITCHDDDEVNGNSGIYVVGCKFTDTGRKQVPVIHDAKVYNVGDVISLETAIGMFKYLRDDDAAIQVLKYLGYEDAALDEAGFRYYCKNCSIGRGYKPTAFKKGTSSVVKFNMSSKPKIYVQVFNEKATQSFYDQFEKLDYSWQGCGTGMGALMYKKDIYDQNEQELYLITSKGYAYQEHGGYYLILGGEL